MNDSFLQGINRTGKIIRGTFILLLLFASAAAADPGIETGIRSGYDSFIDRYTILENDTTESLNEYYFDMTNRYSAMIGSIDSKFRNSFKFGNQSVDERLRVSLGLEKAGPFDASLETEFYLKHFREGSDYTLSNNYRQVNTALKIGRKYSENFRIDSRTRFELIDYDDHTRFDYDYNYIDTGLEIGAGSVLGNAFRATASFGLCEAPDTTELNYNRVILEAGVYLGSWGSRGLECVISADRRRYRTDARPSSWLIISFSKIPLMNSDKAGLSLTFDQESYIYDSSDQIYFDSHFLRGGAEFAVPAWESSRVLFQPRYARLLCSEMEEERYGEYSLSVSYEFMYGAGYWFSFSYEPGYRSYQIEDIYSNFTFNRVSLMGSVSIYGNLSADLFLMHDPEKHSRRGDDFSITLISAAISTRF